MQSSLGSLHLHCADTTMITQKRRRGRLCLYLIVTLPREACSWCKGAVVVAHDLFAYLAARPRPLSRRLTFRDWKTYYQNTLTSILMKLTSSYFVGQELRHRDSPGTLSCLVSRLSSCHLRNCIGPEWPCRFTCLSWSPWCRFSPWPYYCITEIFSPRFLPSSPTITSWKLSWTRHSTQRTETLRLLRCRDPWITSTSRLCWRYFSWPSGRCHASNMVLFIDTKPESHYICISLLHFILFLTSM